MNDPLVIAVDDPNAADVRELVATHLAFAHEVTPICHVHALPIDVLAAAYITLLSARRRGNLLGIGALKRLDDTHAEIKSMHTTAPARGQGVGAALVARLLATAGQAGFTRVSLETGTQEAFAPARSLYERSGFTQCPPFGDYTDNPHSVCMTLLLGP